MYKQSFIIIYNINCNCYIYTRISIHINITLIYLNFFITYFFLTQIKFSKQNKNNLTKIL